MPSYTPTTGSGSALAAQERYNLQNFVQWAISNSIPTSRLMVSEMGIPGSCQAGIDHDYDPGYWATLEQVFVDFDYYNMHVMLWESGEWNEDLKVFRNAIGDNSAYSYRSTTSSVLGGHLTGAHSVTAYRGTNMSGAEQSDDGPNGALNAGTLGAQYYFPQENDWVQLGNFGVNLVRLCIRWERLQPTLLQPLNTAYLNEIITALGYAHANGIHVALDTHNYGRYDTAAATNTTGSTSGVLDLGQNAPTGVGGTMIAAFNDYWGRVATALVGTPGLWAYSICNEPNALTGGVNTWQLACQGAVEAIRLKDQTAHITVGGYNFQGMSAWVANNTNGGSSGPWLTETIPAGQTGAGSARNSDPLIIWDAHQYFDYDGTYSDDSGSSTFASENANAVSAGFSPYTNSGYTPPTYDITSQTGIVPVFQSTFIPSDYSGTYDAIKTNSNTVNLGYNIPGDPNSYMQVIATTTSDEGGVQKSLGASTIRVANFDFMIPSGATLSNSNNFAVAHFWRDDDATDLIEIRIVGDSTGYLAGLTVPSGSYTLVNSGGTILPLGTRNNLQFLMTDTDLYLYVNGASTAEAIIPGSYSGIHSAGFFMGKYYGTSYAGPMYYANLKTGNDQTYDAPVNGGLLPTIAPPATGSSSKNLMGLFSA
jgi:hypothetical protein